MSFMCGEPFSFLSHDFTFCLFVCWVDIFVGNVVKSFSVRGRYLSLSICDAWNYPLLHLFCGSFLHCKLLLYYTMISCFHQRLLQLSCHLKQLYICSSDDWSPHRPHLFSILFYMVSFFLCSSCFLIPKFRFTNIKSRLFLPLLFVPYFFRTRLVRGLLFCDFLSLLLSSLSASD